MTRSTLVLALALLACGPAGTLTGKVTVEGGSAANLAVLVYGPTSTATVTKDDGTFSATSLPDGAYVVRVVLRGAELEDQSVPGTVKNGKTDVAPNLTFKLPGGRVTGKVAFTDGSDTSNLAVALSGTASRGTTTGTGGAFTFETVPTGAYLVEVASPDTREGRVGVGVAVAGMTTDVGTLTLTPVGRVNGTVTLAGAPQAGVTVIVAGTELRATTSAAGTFSFSAVPAGNQTFVARTASPATRVASVPVTVLRGANPEVAMALMDETRTGTVTGSVTFFGQQSPTIIKVSVPGTTVNVSAGPDGAYTLQVPAGSWDVVATAPLFPTTMLGHVFVAEGVSQALPGKTLSWFEPMWTSPQPLNDAFFVGFAGPWYLLQVSDANGSRDVLINRATREARVLSSAALTVPRFSKTGKVLAFVVNAQLFTYDTATGAMKAWGTQPDQLVQNVSFSSDESTMFVQRTAPSSGVGVFLERVALATGVTTRYPAAGLAQQILTHTVDRLLVWEGSNDVTLVQPTTETPQLFTQVARLLTQPTPMAMTGCAAAVCTLKVVAPNGTTANTVPGTFSQSAAAGSLQGATGDYPFVVNGGLYNLIRAADGAIFPMPPSLNTFSFNSTNTRYAITYVVGANVFLREEALPPTNSAAIAQTTTAFSVGYVSPTRLLATDTGTVRRIIDVKSGVATIDSDVLSTGPTANTAYRSSAGLLWPSSTKWKFIVGDQAAVGIDGVSTALTPLVTVTRGGEPTTQVGFVSWDQATTWVVDGAAGTVRRSNAGTPLLGPERWGSTELWRPSRPSNQAFVTVGATEEIIEVEFYPPSLPSLLGSDRTIAGVNGNQLLMAWPR